MSPHARRRWYFVTPLLLVALAAALVVGQRATLNWGAAAAPDNLDSSLASGRPEVDRLDPGLRESVWKAAAAARAEGHGLVLNSGWRSKKHQARLFDEAVRTHGTVRLATRFVASPERSSHVTGDAVDVGPPEAAAWLDRNGGRFGLCRTFANEGWHFEKVATPSGTCPALLPDASALS